MMHDYTFSFYTVGPSAGFPIRHFDAIIRLADCEIPGLYYVEGFVSASILWARLGMMTSSMVESLAIVCML